MLHHKRKRVNTHNSLESDQQQLYTLPDMETVRTKTKNEVDNQKSQDIPRTTAFRKRATLAGASVEEEALSCVCLAAPATLYNERSLSSFG